MKGRVIVSFEIDAKDPPDAIEAVIDYLARLIRMDKRRLLNEHLDWLKRHTQVEFVPEENFPP